MGKKKAKESLKDLLRAVRLYDSAVGVKHLLEGASAKSSAAMDDIARTLEAAIQKTRDKAADARLEARHRTLKNRDVNARLNLEEIEQKKDRLLSYPTQVITEVTRKCNIECRMCFRYQQNFRGEDMSDKLFEKLKREFFPFASTISFSGSGEPLMYKRWDELVEEVRKYEFMPQINTNATLITEQRAKALVDANFRVDLSIDAATEETYKYIRGASFKAVVRNIERMRDHKERTGNKKFKMYLVFTPQLPNLKELPAVVDLAKLWGISLIIVQPWNPNVPNQALSPDHDKELANVMYLAALDKALGYGIPIQLPGLYPLRGDEHDRMRAIYQRHNKEHEVRENTIGDGARTCPYPFKTAYVWYDGDVYPCCFGYPKLGNLNDLPFDKIWNGEVLRRLRRELIDRKPNDICSRCFNSATIIS